ncbi:MAG TPA: hypothetical protein ENN43_03225 [bacterium]|nr:hypothetical protein [bacterium]
MKPFDCDFCGLKAASRGAAVMWNFDRAVKTAGFFRIVHDIEPCNLKGEGNFFNRKLPLEYVFKNMPEFLAYINRFSVKEKELKELVKRIEKDRSYIRRFRVDKKEVRKLIIRMDGLGEKNAV